LNNKSDAIGVRPGANRSHSGVYGENLQQRLAPISSLLFGELMIQDTSDAGVTRKPKQMTMARHAGAGSPGYSNKVQRDKRYFVRLFN